MNKRGQIALIPLIIGVLVVLGIVGFFASSEFRWILIGIAIIAGTFIYVLPSILKGNVTRNKIAILLIILGIGVFFIMGSGVLNTIVGVSTYTDTNGKNHWLINGVADNVDEGYIFTSLPSSITSSDGSKITPKETAKLIITKKESYCSYQSNLVEKKKFLLSKLSYYELLSAERVALISVKDDSGNEKIIDGTITQTEPFYDNNGKLTFKSLGISQNKKDCESANNVAILIDDTGKVIVKNKDELNNWYDSLSIVNVVTSLFNTLTMDVKDNINFLSNFDDYSFKNQRFIGDLKLGSVNFVIDADQDYYNSFVYEPPKEVKPKVSIKMPDNIKTDGTSYATITINNNGYDGSVVLKANVNTGSVSPEKENFVLSNKEERTLILKVPNMEGGLKLNVEVCSISEPINCDSASGNTMIKKDAPDVVIPIIKKKVIINETSPTVVTEKCIPFIQEPYTTSEEVGKGPFGIGKIFGLTETKTTSGCKTSAMFGLLLFSIILTISVILVFTIGKKKKKKK